MDSERHRAKVDMASSSEEASASEADDVELRHNPAGGAAGGRGQERPKTILQFIEYAYAEEGRKLTLAGRDMQNLRIGDVTPEVESDTVKRLAENDRLLAVPPSILATLADLGAPRNIQNRVVDLVMIALVAHPVFADKADRMKNADLAPILTAGEISQAAKQIKSADLGMTGLFEFTAAAARKLRTNAVTAFLLLRVIRDRWLADRFIEGMADSVWNLASQSDAKVAASLAAAKNVEALSHLSRRHNLALMNSREEIAQARSNVALQSRRIQALEAAERALENKLGDERAKSNELLAAVRELQEQLSAERSNRVVDKSHLVDDFETLRTQVLRRLTPQAELLTDGLHALRNGSSAVAEEFVDRALQAIGAEVARLKNLDGDQQW